MREARRHQGAAAGGTSDEVAAFAEQVGVIAISVVRVRSVPVFVYAAGQKIVAHATVQGVGAVTTL